MNNLKDLKGGHYYSPDYIPIPEELNPKPVPFPEPIQPIPLPFCPKLWAISGRYEGQTGSFGKFLDLRIDIDNITSNTPVMNRVSGDFYNCMWIFKNPFQATEDIPKLTPFIPKIYKESWIVDDPVIIWGKCGVKITGDVRFWKGVHPSTTVSITISWFGKLSLTRTANVTFFENGIETMNITCTKKSSYFRTIHIEFDYCNSVDVAPLEPSYNTHWHDTRPPDIPERTLTIFEAYAESGIELISDSSNTNIIDDSASTFDTWSVGELHDAMESHFANYPGNWPKWYVWGLMAGTYVNSGVGGIMFDAAATYGGSGEKPERQGFAVFRNHSWFDNLVSNPSNQDQYWSMRHFLYTWVHEAGHAFNLLHSWDKNRADSLSWMNYDWKYDARNGADSFWENFMFRFDDDELIHMRHGDRSSVIMGGDEWASGGHAENTNDAYLQIIDQLPLEVLIRSKGYFDFLEPINIEVRLRNLLIDQDLGVDSRLSPENRLIKFIIKQPNGKFTSFESMFCEIGTSETIILKPSNPKVQGPDRFSQSVGLTFGTGGFYFAQPGDYQIRAIYDFGHIKIPSNIMTIRVGYPTSKENEILAQDYFSKQVGLALSFDGSQSPYLKKGMEIIQNIAEQQGSTALGANLSRVIAHSVARSFHKITDYKKLKLTQIHKPDQKAALKITEKALAFYKQNPIKNLNLEYRKLVDLRSACSLEIGDKNKAKSELKNLTADLAKRGVNQIILEQIKKKEDKIK